MKNFVYIVILFTSYISAHANDNKIACEYGIPEFFVMELVDSIEKQSRFNARELSKKLILKQCQNEVDKGNRNIRVRGGKIKFSQFSDTYDVKDPLFFCKNRRGYESYLANLAQKFTLFSRERERRKREEEYRKNPRKSEKKPLVRRVSSTVKKPELWDCKIHNYIRTIKRVGKQEKETLTNTYGEESCVPVK